MKTKILVLCGMLFVCQYVAIAQNKKSVTKRQQKHFDEVFHNIPNYQSSVEEFNWMLIAIPAEEEYAIRLGDSCIIMYIDPRNYLHLVIGSENSDRFSFMIFDQIRSGEGFVQVCIARGTYFLSSRKGWADYILGGPFHPRDKKWFKTYSAYRNEFWPQGEFN